MNCIVGSFVDHQRLNTFPNHTAILVFSRYAEEEAAAKKYNKMLRQRGGSLLASQLINHTLREAYQTGLPVIRFFSEKQKGQSFGERLLHAVEESFMAGFDRLIVCGTDTPGLSSRHFLSVAESLHRHDIVLGPSADGGVYLIGLTKASFIKNLFASISWLTPSVFSQLCGAAKQASLVYCVESVEHDVDSPTAIAEWGSTATLHWFSRLVKMLFAAIGKSGFFSSIPVFCSSFYTGLFKHRGPPIFSI